MAKIPNPKTKNTNFSIELDPPEQFRLGAEGDLENESLLQIGNGTYKEVNASAYERAQAKTSERRQKKTRKEGLAETSPSAPLKLNTTTRQTVDCQIPMLNI